MKYRNFSLGTQFSWTFTLLLLSELHSYCIGKLITENIIKESDIPHSRYILSNAHCLEEVPVLRNNLAV